MWGIKFDMFLDISKVFDKLCHEDLIFKLLQGTSGKRLNILKDFLRKKTQRVVVKGQFNEKMLKQTFHKVQYVDPCYS